MNSTEFICFTILGALYVYQSYRHWRLEKFMLTQLSHVWKFQHMVVDTLDRLARKTNQNKNSEAKDE